MVVKLPKDPKPSSSEPSLLFETGHQGEKGDGKAFMTTADRIVPTGEHSRDNTPLGRFAFAGPL